MHLLLRPARHRVPQQRVARLFLGWCNWLSSWCLPDWRGTWRRTRPPLQYDDLGSNGLDCLARGLLLVLELRQRAHRPPRFCRFNDSLALGRKSIKLLRLGLDAPPLRQLWLSNRDLASLDRFLTENFLDQRGVSARPTNTGPSLRSGSSLSASTSCACSDPLAPSSACRGRTRPLLKPCGR